MAAEKVDSRSVALPQEGQAGGFASSFTSWSKRCPQALHW
jgi:hypothetical protein